MNNHSGAAPFNGRHVLARPAHLIVGGASPLTMMVSRDPGGYRGSHRLLAEGGDWSLGTVYWSVVGRFKRVRSLHIAGEDI